MDTAATRIEYDTTSVGSTTLRVSIDHLLDGMNMRKSAGLQGWMRRGPVPSPDRAAIIVADLNRLPAGRDLDYWSAAAGNIAYVVLVRTHNDRKRLREPETALRLNDEKFHLCDMSTLENTGARQVETYLSTYFTTILKRMEPDCVRYARYASADGSLWVEFGDGLERCLDWAALDFTAQLNFTPASASAADGGQAVLLLDANGGEIHVDAGALRAVVDSEYRAVAQASHAAQRETVGRRLRALRLEHGLSQEVLSARSGIPQESLSRLENGSRDPRLETLRKLATGFGVELSDVLARLGHD